MAGDKREAEQIDVAFRSRVGNIKHGLVAHRYTDDFTTNHHQLFS
ncbi:hypothetical protein VR7878_00147 [Vibrio ruber DSM 16370]|uniref:Uncharacterized protein n=1 Tax=Vibrio ruber (strain DSM 16370 / JCM 11486 / BCRC 17186 / CECT 7878 / LMG 23124 / VR1) TaxID=1123498 RepID=A0A1R4L905_VIBR1|nr:hypothetical protein VR7878_00147 [Vibrio ruber DSM 16370]